jgi:ABC-type enterochelin transport system substrate-binding protein
MKIMGETSVHWTRLVLSGSAIAAVIAMSGCDPQSSPEASTTSSAQAASPAPVASSAAPADDADTTKDNATRVAKAEKIGPPAGNIAVSAQWAAGSTAVIAHSIGASGAVSTAADEVQKEMMNLSDAYNKSADAKPSEKKLEAAINSLNTACSAA